MTYIAKNLRYLRKLAELSQQSFAGKIGLNRGNIASYEKGAAEPNTQNLLKIARYFNIDLIDFVEKDLSSLVSDQLIEVKGDGNRVKFGKNPLPQIVESWQQRKSDELETNSIQVLAERSASLYSILEGTKQFYRMAQERQRNGNWKKNYDQLSMDFGRTMDLTIELMDINRQLFRLLTEREVKQEEETSSENSAAA
jgi:transcriptional regulator with XRE-family HTH domain